MKLLKVIFIILILVTIGEVGYYLYITNYKANFNSSKLSAVTQVGSPSATVPSITDPTLHPQAKIKVETKEFNERAEMIQRGILTSSVIEDKFQSEIAGLDTKGGKKADFEYKVNLSIKVGDNTVDFLLNDNGFEKVKVYQRIGGKDEKISFEDLQVGDKIIIERKLDTLKEVGYNVVEFKLTKI